MTTAMYLRVSSHIQADANGTDSQRHAIAAWLTSQGIGPETVASYEDIAISGKNMVRPEWKRLQADIRAGTVKTVIAYSISRVGRNTAEVATWVSAMHERGVRVVFVKEGMDMARKVARIILLPILSAVAEMERENIRDSTKAGIAAARAKDPRWGVSRNPYGSPKGPKFAPEVREQAKARIMAGEAIRTVARELGANQRSVRRWCGLGDVGSMVQEKA